MLSPQANYGSRTLSPGAVFFILGRWRSPHPQATNCPRDRIPGGQLINEEEGACSSPPQATYDLRDPIPGVKFVFT